MRVTIYARVSTTRQAQAQTIEQQLTRLRSLAEQQGWILSSWEMSEQNRRAKYYRLTDNGRKRLQEEHAEWSQFAATVARVMGGLPEEQS